MFSNHISCSSWNSEHSVCACVCVCVHACAHVWVCACVCVHVYVCEFMHMHVCVYICMCVCVRVCMSNGEWDWCTGDHGCCLWSHCLSHTQWQTKISTPHSHSDHKIISSGLMKPSPDCWGQWRRLSKCRRWLGKEWALSVKHGRSVTPYGWVRWCRTHEAANDQTGWECGVGGWSTTWSAHSLTEKETIHILRMMSLFLKWFTLNQKHLRSSKPNSAPIWSLVFCDQTSSKRLRTSKPGLKCTRLNTCSVSFADSAQYKTAVTD